jgi:long-chain acyl-CoA synthetase
MLPSLLSAASSTSPDRPALAHEGTTLTYAELARAVGRLASALEVAPGERVAVVAPNVPALVVGLFATWDAGAVAVPLSARLRRFELARAFADAQPVAVVSVREHGGFQLSREIGELARETGSVRRRIVVDDVGEVEVQPQVHAAAPASPSPPDLAAILYTSGTTGEPKGALVPHLLADAMSQNLAEVMGEDAGAAHALVVPASHAFGLGCLLYGIVGGAKAVMVERTSSLEPLLQAVRRHDAQLLHGSPALFGRLLRSDADARLRGGFVAGSWCPPKLLQALDERGMRVLNLYGMTEIGAAASCRHQDPPERRYRTVGRPLPGYEVRAVDGEIQVRSGYLPTGYHGRPWSSEEVADGEWFRTGDLGEVDPQGFLQIAGRAKEVVHVGGFNVFPAEVESFLLTHPAIAQAAVIGVPHAVLGEALQAFVVTAPDAALEPREVISFARRGIAGYKVPYDVRMLEELPLLASGKPDRRALRGMARREEAVR